MPRVAEASVVGAATATVAGAAEPDVRSPQNDVSEQHDHERQADDTDHDPAGPPTGRRAGRAPTIGGIARSGSSVGASGMIPRAWQPSYTRRMSRALVEQRLTELSERLRETRRELAIADEQLASLADDADDARLRSLVSETPLAEQEHREASRHAEAMARHRRLGPWPRSSRWSGPRTTCSTGSSLERLTARRPDLGPRRPDGRRPGFAVRCRFRAGEQKGTQPVPTRVVIAEDEAIIRLDLKETLEEEGYLVVGETGRGDEAVELVKEHEPDVAILDIKMPGLDGLSAAREIAGERRAAVLILTAFSQRDLIEQARDAGALAYLVKPFQRSELIPALEVAIGRFQEMKALHDQAPSLEEQLETRKVVDRAKGRLMDEHGLTEQEAFSFIQRTAMRERLTMKAVGEQVLSGELAPAADAAPDATPVPE